MATFNLYWNPGAVTTALSQQVQYKLRSAGSFIIYATIPGYKDNYVVSGLLDNQVYDFRIANTCNAQISYTPVVSYVSFDCPLLSFTRSDDTILYSFTGDDGIDRYKITLYKDGIYETEDAYTSPYSVPVTGTFTALNNTSLYTISVIMTKGDLTGVCNTTGDVQVVCVSINGMQGGTM